MKCWDLEKPYQLVSSSSLESTRVRCIEFHPEGLALYSAGQDTLKVHWSYILLFDVTHATAQAYSWEPTLCLDAVAAGWGKASALHAIDSSRMVCRDA